MKFKKKSWEDTFLGIDKKKRSFYTEYGKVFIVTPKKLVLLLDLVIPCGWIIALLIPERYNFELKRISLRND